MASSRAPAPVTGDFLAREAERALLDYSWAWEGEREEVTDLGGALLRTIAVPWSGLDGMVVRIDMDPADADERLDAVIARAEEGGRRLWWIAGPSARPADLVDRLVARGLVAEVEWAGLALRDLSVEIPANPDLVVEPLAPGNAEEYATFCADLEPDHDPRTYTERLASAHRYLDAATSEAQIYLGRLDGQVAACVVSRIEPTGVVYLRNAETRPEFQRRGIYRSLVAYRLAVARAAGCTAAVVQAQTRSSAPILLKRGFERVCTLYGLTRPTTEAASG